MYGTDQCFSDVVILICFIGLLQCMLLIKVSVHGYCVVYGVLKINQ